MADTWPRKCINCGEEVNFNGKDNDFSGFGPCEKRRGKHVVENKLYFHPGARDVQDIRDRKRFSPTLILVPVYEKEVDGKRLLTKGLSVQFFNGKLETTDPEVQFYLEEKRDVASGEEGLQMWQEIYLTPEQQTEVAKATLAATKREIKEANDLLASVRASKGAKQATV